jgi:glycosyltransferase involved in cell wall biosynthesis
VRANARSATVEAGATPAAIAPAAAPRRDGDARPSRLADALRAARWTLRRWSLKHIWYRARLPIRRRRWAAANLERTQAFAKDPAARPTAGPAIAFGAFSGAFGLARAAAYDLPALRARHAAVTAIDIDPYLKGAPRRPLDLAGPFDNVYFLCQPDTYGMICELLRPSDVAAAYRVGRWVWETPRFPDAWRFAARLIHEVWTPSEYCAATFRAALDLPVRVVPYAVTAPPDPGLDMRARLGVPRQAFMGLAVMDILPCPERKNPWAHVRAWQAAFGDDANAVLVMKVRVGKRTRLVLDELRELIGRATNIRLIADEMSDDEIAALHHAADLYLSLHRAEGFGLNIYEALLIGKPVVATHWSANAEYGPRFENYVGVPARMTRYRDWMGQYAGGAFEWAEGEPVATLTALRNARIEFSKSAGLRSR